MFSGRPEARGEPRTTTRPCITAPAVKAGQKAAHCGPGKSLASRQLPGTHWRCRSRGGGRTGWPRGQPAAAGQLPGTPVGGARTAGMRYIIRHIKHMWGPAWCSNSRRGAPPPRAVPQAPPPLPAPAAQRSAPHHLSLGVSVSVAAGLRLQPQHRLQLGVLDVSHGGRPSLKGVVACRAHRCDVCVLSADMRACVFPVEG